MPDGRPVLIAVKDASRIYGTGDAAVAALRNASLDVIDGEFLVVVGPSGSGKSTILNLIGGLDRPTSGTVLYNGKDLAGFSDRDLTLYRRNEIGFIFQFYNLVPTLTAIENVQVTTELVQDPIDPLEALRMVGLEKRADHFPSQLSGGEQQRVSIARALAGNPGLLLCDEPTGALDLETSRTVLDLLMRLKREFGKTLVVITHNVAINAIADRVAHMRDGSIVQLEINEAPQSVAEIQW